MIRVNGTGRKFSRAILRTKRSLEKGNAVSEEPSETRVLDFLKKRAENQKRFTMKTWEKDLNGTALGGGEGWGERRETVWVKPLAQSNH